MQAWGDFCFSDKDDLLDRGNGRDGTKESNK